MRLHRIKALRSGIISKEWLFEFYNHFAEHYEEYSFEQREDGFICQIENKAKDWSKKCIINYTENMSVEWLEQKIIVPEEILLKYNYLDRKTIATVLYQMLNKNFFICLENIYFLNNEDYLNIVKAPSYGCSLYPDIYINIDEIIKKGNKFSEMYETSEEDLEATAKYMTVCFLLETLFHEIFHLIGEEPVLLFNFGRYPVEREEKYANMFAKKMLKQVKDKKILLMFDIWD